MYKVLTLSLVLILGFTGINAYAQNSTDENQHNEIEKFEKERTIQIVEEKDTENKVQVSTALFVSNVSGVESISNSSLNNSDKLKSVDENSLKDPKNGKKKVALNSVGEVIPSDFFESTNKGSESNQGGAQCSTVGVSY